MSLLALATSIAHFGISIGHTMLGLELFARPVWSPLPVLEFAYSQAGWYQGSISFAIFGIFNYQLSRRDPSTWTLYDRAITTLILILYWGTSQWYLRRGDSKTGILMAVVGGLQSLTVVQ
ncbi:uncharacterized protein Z520_11390 [Fonsecaea multimorphosa CBS 102226]|uniref:Uncharacterized protein n=1 Tax=Fonsecaea multimorphosa CBS 102226 TaxID=1442371 RepID=A0A0D2JR50_9EURO|nr:uncharacterized protein Z520_11390 [Fonsecaea multimorphosa CBS 102226]KIX92914.1 hypothetical protein Z520_11390 [Fonsecaea multimorphosa CBS 102226]